MIAMQARENQARAAVTPTGSISTVDIIASFRWLQAQAIPAGGRAQPERGWEATAAARCDSRSGAELGSATTDHDFAEETQRDPGCEPAGGRRRCATDRDV